MKDKNKPKKQLIDELDGMRQRVAQFEGSASKDGTKEDEKHIRDLAFLSMIATGFLELSLEDNIYEFIAGHLKELGGNSIILVNSFEEATDCVCCRAVLGLGEKMEAIVSILGKHPVGMFLKIDNEARLGLTSGKLVEVPGGFYEFCFRRIPRTVCHAIEKVLDLGDIYAMGFAWKGKLFGSASILTHKGTQLADQTVIETFIYQASVALQQRRAEQALRKAHDELEIRVEERTRELAEANAQLRAEITERKWVEERTKQLQEYLQLQVDRMPMGLIVWDTEFRVQTWNPAAEEIFSFTAEEALGRHPYEIIVPREAQPQVDDIWHRLLEGDTTAHSINENITKDGRTIICEWSNTPFKKADGKVVGVLSMVQDITDHKRAEEALRENERRYRLLAENAKDVIWTVDMNMRPTYMSPSITRLLGYSVEEAMALPMEAVYAPASFETAMKVLAEELAVENMEQKDLSRSRTLELELTRKDGSIVPVEIRYTFIREPDGRPIAILAIARDITERKLAEEKIKRAAEEWRTTFDSITDLVFICDKDFRLTRVNKAFAGVFKKKPAELIGKPCYEIVHGTNESVPNCLHKKTFETKKPTTAEFFEPHLGMYLEVSTSPIFNEKGEVVASVHLIRDITERKKMDEQLVVTDRLASIGELSSGIAHELNNPLTSVIGFSDLLLNQDVSDDVKEDLKVINREAQRTAGVVRSLLTFARKHETEKKPVHIRNIIQNVLELRAYEQRVNNIQVNTQFASDLPEIVADGFQLQQVFINIIINAEHFMSEAHGRGTLTITIERGGDIIRASFADDGPGIAKENLGHVFDPFFTTKEVGKGTGLGLSICHGIITEHGGSIYAESELGKGATFIIELPINK